MKFIYKARTKEGKIETGNIEASSKDAAAVLLQKYNIFVTSLTPATEKFSIFKKISFETNVSTKDLAIFSRQLAVMLESRVPVVQSLSSLAVQSNNDSFRRTATEVASMVEEGVSLSEAFGKFPKVFDNFYVNLVKSGEVSGKISETLYYIADHLESEHNIKSQVQQAMIYPAFTISVLFLVIGIIIVFIVPRIQDLILESSTNPPLFTVIMLRFYQLVESFWWLVALLFFSLVAGLIFYFRTGEGKKVFDRLSLKIPFIGDILRKVFLARFCGNISTLMTAGISINKALSITSETVNNSVYKDIINEIENKVSEGEKISSVLISHQVYFPAFVIQMIKVGEETGKLDKTLMEVVRFYEKEIKRSIDLFLTLLEPILIIFLGVIVAFIAISVFAPLYSSLGNL